MSSNREYGKERRSRKNSTKKRTSNDYESSHHYEQKVKKMLSKDRNEKYKRYDAEEDFYS
jgi:hypothetical protein